MSTQVRYPTSSGTDGFVLDDSGNLTIAGTFTAGAIAPSSLALTDGEALVLGTGSDDTILHNGTLSLWMHTTGDLVIDNTAVTGKTILRLGTDTTATAIEFRNNSDAACWTFLPGSASLGYLRGNDNSPLVLGTGNDDIISHDATNSKWTHATGDLTFDNTNVTGATYIDMGTDTTATKASFRNNSGTELLKIGGDGTLTLGGTAHILAQTIAAATGTAIPVTHSGSFPITTAAAETNTLAIPTFIGQTMTIFVDTYAVGDRVVTSAQRINQANNTIMTFGAVGDCIKLEAITIGGALRWQVIANDGVALS